MGQVAHGACQWLTGTGRVMMALEGLPCICHHVENPAHHGVFRDEQVHLNYGIMITSN
jgi:hypothetical protein